MTTTGELVLEGRLIEDGGAVRIVVREGVVAELERLERDPASDAWIAPGWIDLQVNGFGGHDPNAADARGAGRRGHGSRPVAVGDVRRLPHDLHPVRGADPAFAAGRGRCLRADPLVAASVVGIHVEGPHIAREDGPRGAHPLEYVRPPDIAEYHRWQAAARGRVRIITVSPEYPESVDYIRAIVADGVVASIGHTAADGDQIRAAVDAGARWSTHLGNGAHALIPRHPNYIWEQLAEDRLSAGLIFDGHHLPPAVIRTMLRAKGIERTILVTDALALAGCLIVYRRTAEGWIVTRTSDARSESIGRP